MPLQSLALARWREILWRSPLAARLALLTLSAAWIASLLLGLSVLRRFESAAGPESRLASHWPANTEIAPPHEQLPTLLMFAHPRCPCTRASIAELEQLMTHFQGQVDARVYFLLPSDAGADWSQSDLVEQARAIPGVTVAMDPDHREADCFGARTSGCTLVFDPPGNLLFSGGITAARGQIGENVGVLSVASLLAGTKSETSATQVFGCPLADPPQSR